MHDRHAFDVALADRDLRTAYRVGQFELLLARMLLENAVERRRFVLVTCSYRFTLLLSLDDQPA